MKNIISSLVAGSRALTFSATAASLEVWLEIMARIEQSMAETKICLPSGWVDKHAAAK